MRIYVETDLILHFIQANVPISGAVSARLIQTGVRTVVSDLTRMECSVLALRGGGTLRQDFDIFLAACDVLPLTPTVMDRAAEIQFAYGSSATVAIHLAVADVHGCDEYLSRNRRLKRYTGVRVQVI